MGDNIISDRNVVYMGILKKGETKEQLTKSILDLFTRCLAIPLTLNVIHIRKGKKGRYAFIQLKSEEDVKTACDILGSWETRSRLNFNVLQLIDSSQTLIVSRKFTANTRSIGGQYSRRRFYEEGELLGNETRNKEFKKGTGEYFVDMNLKEHVAKYMCGFLNSSEHGTLFIGVNDKGKVEGIECDQKKEDKIRLKIDEGIKTIKPTVFPQIYHVEFVPIYKDGHVKADVKVIEITVYPDELSELYKASGAVYVRRDGSVEKLKPFQIQDWEKLKPFQIQDWEKQRKKTALRRDQEKELQNARTKLEELKAEVNSLQTERNSALNKMEEFETEKNALETEKNTLQREKSAIRRERSTLQKEVELQQKKIHDLEKRKKSKVCVVL